MIEKTPKISIADASAIIQRFAEMPGFPRSEVEVKDASGDVSLLPGPGQQALIRAFQHAAKDHDHAERIARMLEDGFRSGDDPNASHYAPQPTDVYYAATAIASRGAIKEFTGFDAKCPHCQDTGFVRSAPLTDRNGTEYTSVQLCRCRRAHSA